MVALARAQSAAAAAEAEQLSSSSSNDMLQMLKAIPKENLSSVSAMVEAGQHGARLHNMPTMMAIRCTGKAGKPLLRGIDLRFAYFCRCRLKAIDLSSCDLTAASFIDCDFTDAKLASAKTDGLSLSGSLLHSTDLDWVALLNKARDDITDDERVVVTGCSFRPFKLSPDCTISRVDLSNCRINDAIAVNVKLQNVTLRGAKLVRTPTIHTALERLRLFVYQCVRRRFRECLTAPYSAAAIFRWHNLTGARLWAHGTMGVRRRVSAL
jgi:uncharacterized protein YjbI with pentapeptide repeats